MTVQPSVARKIHTVLTIKVAIIVNVMKGLLVMGPHVLVSIIVF